MRSWWPRRPVAPVMRAMGGVAVVDMVGGGGGDELGREGGEGGAEM